MRREPRQGRDYFSLLLAMIDVGTVMVYIGFQQNKTLKTPLIKNNTVSEENIYPDLDHIVKKHRDGNYNALPRLHNEPKRRKNQK